MESLYEKYEQKMKKIAHIKNTILRFKILILSAFALVIGLVVSYLSVCGMILTDLPPMTEMTYGDVISCETSALFSKVHYEYSLASVETWSDEVPKLPGEYKIRAVSHRSFGMKGYGKEYPFTILAKNIDVRILESSVEFGGVPTPVSTGLVGKDHFVYDGQCFEFADHTVQTTKVSLKENTLKIVDEEGTDVTAGYIMNLEKDKDISYVARKLTIQLKDQTKEYDGTPLTSEEYEIVGGSLLEGHRLEIGVKGSQLNVGSSNNIGVSARILSENEDVSANYQVQFLSGRLTIQKRKITIQTDSDQKIYDGKTWIRPDYGYELSEGNLVSGHQIKVVSKPTVLTVGTYANHFDFQIVDSQGEDVTGNYELTLEEGTLEVLPKPITISTKEASKIYDGIPLVEYALTEEPTLAENQQYRISYTGSQLFVGESENKATISLYEGSVNVTSNYQITYHYGKLKVEARSLTIRPKIGSWIYDGTYKTISQVDYLSSSLAASDRIEVETDRIRNAVAGYENHIRNIKIYHGTTEVTQCYDIIKQTNTMTITRRPLRIEPQGETLTYDGLEHSLSQYRLSNSTTLGSGDVLKIETPAHWKTGIYVLSITSYSITYENEDVSSNYEVTLNTGQLNIQMRTIYLTTQSAEKVYDNQPLTCYEVQLDRNTSLASTDRLQMSYSNSILEPGSTSNLATANIVHSGENVNHCYHIVWSYGKLTIRKRPLSLRAMSADKEYDGTPLEATSYEVVGAYDVLLEHTLSVTVAGSITDYGTSPTRIVSHQIVDENHKDVSKNYEVEYLEGVLKISQRTILVQTGTEEWEYDDQAHSNEVISADRLVEGHQLKIQTKETITEVGNKANEITVKVIAGTQDVTNNYSIRYDYGNLSVTPRKMTVTTPTHTWIYQSYDFSDTEIETDRLISTHTTKISSYPTLRHVGSISNNVLVEIMKNGVSVTKNYEITYVYGTLSITPQRLELEILDKVKEYDGEELTSDEYSVSGLQGTDRIVVLTTTGRVTYVHEGFVENDLNSLQILDEFGTDVMKDYEVVVQKGTLSITPRPLVVKPIDLEKIYDSTPLVHKSSDFETIRSTSLVSKDHGQMSTANRSVTNVWDGIVQNQITEFKIFNENGLDITSSYEITYETGTLKINPRPILIETGSYDEIYDGETHRADTYQVLDRTDFYPLVSGQTIVVISDWETVKDALENNKENKIEIEIYQGDFEVTGNYLISWEYGYLMVHRRPITIVSDDGEKVYDDEWFQVDSYRDIGEYRILEKHRAEVESIKVRDADVYENRLTLTLYEGTEDVTANYEIIYIYGTLTILKRAIVVQTGSDELTYDGNSHRITDFEVVATEDTYLLVSGHTFEIVDSTNEWFVGSYENQIYSFEIHTSDNRTVSKNYEVSYQTGTLTILKRTIKFHLNDVVAMYDGTEHTCEQGYSVENMASSDMIMNVKFAGSAKYVSDGIVKCSIESILILNMNQGWKSSLDCYELEVAEGSVQIMPRPVTVQLTDETKEYDGTPLTSNRYQIPTGSKSFVDGDIFTILETSGSITEVGRTGNTILSYTIVDRDGIDRAENYTLSFVDGNLEVCQRQLRLQSVSAEKEYDRTELYAPTVDHFNLLEGHTIEYETDSFPTLSEIKSIENTFDYRNLHIYDENHREVTDCYVVETEYGTLTIQKRKLVVESLSAEKEFDGLPLTKNEYRISRGSLLDGDEISVEFDDNAFCTYVGTKENLFDCAYDEKHYEVLKKFGSLTITKYQLKLRGKTFVKEYDGNGYQKENYTIMDPRWDTRPESLSEYQVVLSYQIVAESGRIYTAEEALTLPDIYRIIITATVRLQNGNTQIDGEKVADQFEVSEGTAQITIKKRSLYVAGPSKLDKMNDWYNKNGLSCSSETDEVEIIYGSLLSTHQMQVTYTSVLYHIGSVQNKFSVVILNESSEDVTEYYNITYSYGTLQLT